jgi:hypothetical protein
MPRIIFIFCLLSFSVVSQANSFKFWLDLGLTGYGIVDDEYGEGSAGALFIGVSDHVFAYQNSGFDGVFECAAALKCLEEDDIEYDSQSILYGQFFWDRAILLATGLSQTEKTYEKNVELNEKLNGIPFLISLRPKNYNWFSAGINISSHFTEKEDHIMMNLSLYLGKLK